MGEKQRSWLAIGLVAGVSIFFAAQLPRLQFDYDLEMFFPAGDPETQFFKKFRTHFGNDDDYVLVGLESPTGVIFEYEFLSRIDSLRRQIETLPWVQYVHGPTNLRQVERNPVAATPMRRPYLHLRDTSRYAADSARIYKSRLVNYIFSADRESVLLFVRHDDLLSQEKCRMLTDSIRSAVNALNFSNVHFAGKCFGQTYFIQLIQRETAVFVGASVLFVIWSLWFTYRTFWGLWMPMTVVGLSVLWTLGLMALLGKPVDLVSNIIPTILLVVGISDTMHLLTHYLGSRRSGVPADAALRSAVREVGRATLLTSLTTALGFLTLTSSSFRPLVFLGIYLSVGIFIALGLTYALLPAFLRLQPKLQRPQTGSTDFWDEFLAFSFAWVKRQRWVIIAVSALVMALSAWSTRYITVNNYILTDLRPSNPLQQDHRFFADKFAGPRPFECMVRLQDGSSREDIFEPELLKELTTVGKYLREVYGVKNLMTPAVMIRQANQIYHFGDTTFARIPNDTASIDLLAKKLERYLGATQFDRFIAQGGRVVRLRGDMPDWGSYVVRQKNAAFLRFLDEKFPDSKLDYQITGTAYLLDLNNKYLAENVIGGLLLAFTVIAVLFAILFRSLRIALIALVPNVFPLLVVGGAMGAFGIDLKISTSIIFIISLGIAVDDSIHFLSRFRQEKRRAPAEEALAITYRNTGKAIVLTTLILMGGFLVLTLSEFLGTYYIGALVALTLGIAVIADLTLLPALLLVVLPTVEERTTSTLHTGGNERKRE